MGSLWSPSQAGRTCCGAGRAMLPALPLPGLCPAQRTDPAGSLLPQAQGLQAGTGAGRENPNSKDRPRGRTWAPWHPMLPLPARREGDGTAPQGSGGIIFPS